MKFKSREDYSGIHGGGRCGSLADNFNRGIAKVHIKALDHLKGLGFTQQVINDSLNVQGMQGGYGALN